MKKFISILLCMLLSITYFIFVIQLNFSIAFSKKSIDKVIEDMEFTKQISNTGNTVKNPEWDMMLNEMYEVAQDYDISKKEVDDIINSESTKDFILEYIENNTNYIVNSDSSVKLDIDDIQDNIEDAVNNYIEKENNNLTESQKEKISKFTSDNSYKIAEKLPTPEVIEIEMSPKLTKFIQIFFNNTTRIILISLFIILLISIILLQGKKSMLYLGTTLLITNITTLLFSLIINPLVNLLIEFETSIVINLIKNFSKQILKPYLIISSAGIIISIILLVIYKNTKRTISK